MRITLTNLGTRGDVQPLYALARRLQRHGHAPRLLVAPHYRDEVLGLKFDFSPLGPDLDYRSLQRQDTNSELAGENLLMMHTRSLEIMEQMLPLMFEQTLQACRQSDLLIAGHLQPTAIMAAELTSLPFATVHINHFGGQQPPAFREAACKVINPFRGQLGLASLMDPLHTDAHSSQLSLHAISRHLWRPLNALPRHHHIAGFFFLEDPDWNPPAPLLEFLESGTKPVVVSFSSMVHQDPEALTGLLIEAIYRAGSRAIILSGWSGLAKGVRGKDDIHVVEFAPHAWLFPHCSCVVHAGGAGTTAAALRSGTPSVIVPHIVDQPMFAELVRGVGCTRSVIHHRDLTVESLANAIKLCINDDELRRNAQSFGRKISCEDGVEAAYNHLNKLMRDQGHIL